MNSIPSGYDEDVDIGQIELLSVAECICRRPKMYTAGRTLSEIFALFEGYDIATSFAFAETKLPQQFDTSPSTVMNFVATVGIEKAGRPLQIELERIIRHFGSERL